MTGVQTCALPICFPVTIWRVIKEEVEETKEPIAWMEEALDKIWTAIREQHDGYAEMEKHIELIAGSALAIAAEALQVAAMCSKFTALYEKE